MHQKTLTQLNQEKEVVRERAWQFERATNEVETLGRAIPMLGKRIAEFENTLTTLEELSARASSLPTGLSAAVSHDGRSLRTISEVRDYSLEMFAGCAAVVQARSDRCKEQLALAKKKLAAAERHLKSF